MPVISRFYGIAVIMYYNDHSPPHIHVRYAGYTARLSLDGILLEGDLPQKALTLVAEWANLHFTELKANWEKARTGSPLEYIRPLE